MIKEFNHVSKLKGVLAIPGDKSISHRSVMFSCMAKGESRVHHFLNSADIQSTINCFRSMGSEVEEKSDELIIKGMGFKEFDKPKKFLDAGNSGTTSRLICGFLAAQDFETTLIGDESLSQRPMKRVMEPLRLMGASIVGTERDTLPLKISPVKNLIPINYRLPVASAQVKSCILIAGLHLDEKTQVVEPYITRNHTENLLGLDVVSSGDERTIYVSKKNYPQPNEYFVPSDISTAAFFIVFACLAANAEVRIKNVLLNKTRSGIIDVLQSMGARIELENLRSMSGEEVGDIIIFNSKLHNICIDEKIIPVIVDEIPILSIAGFTAEGNYEIRNAKELRVKETDRIAAICHNFRLLGVDVEEWEDGFRLSGEIKNRDVVFESFGDHRISMAFAVLSMLLDDGGKVNDFECINISNPQFLNQVNSLL
ncbi:MAG: 3-phosphoshikimate 1-carboxyvinyltransferase [bacterium]